MDSNSPTETPTSQSAEVPEKPEIMSEPSTPESMPKPGGMKKTMMMVVAAIVVIGGGVGGYLYYQHQQELKKPLKVGELLPFSGGGATAGFGEQKGIELAKKQLGAVNIELVQEDSNCDAEIAKKAIKKLIDQGVVAIIGEACSGASLGALPEATKAKVPMISPSASSAELSTPNDYFFRVVPPDNFQGEFAAKTVYGKGLYKVSLIYSDETYGKGLIGSFKTKFESLGGTIVSDTTYVDGDIDMSMQVAKIKAAQPDAVYLVGIGAASATAVLKQLQASAIKAPVYSGDSLYDDLVISNSGTAAEGLTLTSFPTGSDEFKQLLESEYPNDKQTYGTAQAYDAFTAIYMAIKDGARTGEKIKEKLPSISFDGKSGKISFDSNGEISNASYKYELLQIKDGKFTVVD